MYSLCYFIAKLCFQPTSKCLASYILYSLGSVYQNNSYTSLLTPPKTANREILHYFISSVTQQLLYCTWRACSVKTTFEPAIEQWKWKHLKPEEDQEIRGGGTQFGLRGRKRCHRFLLFPRSWRRRKKN